MFFFNHKPCKHIVLYYIQKIMLLLVMKYVLFKVRVGFCQQVCLCLCQIYCFILVMCKMCLDQGKPFSGTIA